MRTILVANRKGGCGKTTIATTIAAALASRGHAVALADADRQKSSLRWIALRPKAAARIAGLNWSRDKDLGNTPDELDTIVIDGPGALSTSHAESLIAEASEIVVPILPSVFDTDSTDRFLAKIEKLKRVRKGKAGILVVANRIRLKSQALAQLETHQAEAGRPLIARISDRVAYSSLACEGLAIFDRSGPEITLLRNQWQPLLLALEG